MTTPRDAALLIAINSVISDLGAIAAVLAAPDKSSPPIVPPSSPSVPLKAKFAYAPVTSAVTFAAMFNSNSDGVVVDHAWDWGDGTRESHMAGRAGKTWQVAGKYLVTLKVTDAAGKTDVAAQLVVVPFNGAPATQPPAPPPPVPPAVPPTQPSGEIVATPPRISIGTQYPGITGKTWGVLDGPAFQIALNGAQDGDVIDLSGRVFVGNFTLPKRGGAGWLVIRGGGMLPPIGSRMTAAKTAGLPIIQSPNDQPAIQTNLGAHHFRFVGLEVRPTPGVPCHTLVNFGAAAQTQAETPHHLTLDRMYIHGMPGLPVRRGVVLNCAHGAVIDSTISEIHDNNGDSQAILGYNGPGPFLIENSYLESGGEVVMFGGADPSVPGLVPSDITMKRCHVTTNPLWTTWLRKNLLESKSSRRWLVEGCVFEHMPQGGQVGGAILLKSASAGGDPNQGTQDFTLRRSILRNVRSGITIESIPEATGQKRLTDTARITLEDLLMYDIGQQPNDAGIAIYLVGNPDAVLVRHITALALNSAVTFGGGKAKGLRVRDSVFGASLYPIKGDAIAQGIATLDRDAPGWFMEGNVIGLNDQSAIKSYPAKNDYPAVVPIGADFKMQKFLTAGADIDAVSLATSGVVSP